ncbi:CheY-like chemotaxis protein [Paraburkholderia sp. Clong3]
MNQTNTRVFIVDDDDSVRSALARLLRASGYQVECFDSPEAFLERADLTSMPACLVLDLQMPGMTGLEVQRKLDQLLPIVFLTGHGDIGSSVDAMKGGAVDFLPKPVRDSLLLAAVDRRARARVCGKQAAPRTRGNRRADEASDPPRTRSHGTRRDWPPEQTGCERSGRGRKNDQDSSGPRDGEDEGPIDRRPRSSGAKGRRLYGRRRIIARTRRRLPRCAATFSGAGRYR